MREAVSDILVERAQLTDGMSRILLRMLMFSLAGHVLLAASLLFAPGFWTGTIEQESSPMMISLGGAEGPDAGGMTTIAERAVQRVAEPDLISLPAGLAWTCRTSAARRISRRW